MVKSNFHFQFAVRDSQGDRPYQEDYCKVSAVRVGSGERQRDAVLAVLCDGMGGHVSGEVASRSAAEAYVKAFGTIDGSVADRMSKALDASNDALNDAITANPDLKGMGCTLVAAFVDTDGLRWVSVGDSALLLYRNGSLHRLNEDHSLGALLDRQADAQVITRQEAENSPRRRTLRSALTGNKLALKEVRDKPVKLQSGDWIIVASDGLETLNGNEIASLIRRTDAAGPGGLADTLIKAVLDRRSPNQDNISLIPISVSDPDDLHIQPTHWVQREENGTAAEPERAEAKKKSGAGLAIGLTLLALGALAAGAGYVLWQQGAFEVPGVARPAGGGAGSDVSGSKAKPADSDRAATASDGGVRERPKAVTPPDTEDVRQPAGGDGGEPAADEAAATGEAGESGWKPVAVEKPKVIPAAPDASVEEPPGAVRIEEGARRLEAAPGSSAENTPPRPRVVPRSETPKTPAGGAPIDPPPASQP